jgi:hypothetical protein
MGIAPVAAGNMLDRASQSVVANLDSLKSRLDPSDALAQTAAHGFLGDDAI